MRQRALDANGDYQFGTNEPFLVNSPLCVAQAVLTRLKLQTGEWFLDTTDGTPYDGQIIGHGTQLTRDLALRNRILGTPGVNKIDQYVSYVDAKRRYSVVLFLDTIYGTAQVSTALS